MQAELKPKSILEVKAGERTYRMECEPDANLGEVHDALHTMKAYIIDRIKESLALEEKILAKKQEDEAVA